MRSVFYVLGASGSGKSTRARALVADVEARGVPTLLIATDVIRAQLRAVLVPAEHPDLWAESFDTELRADDRLVVARDGREVNVSGFFRQCAPIVACVEAAVDYALAEGWSCVVEGVHLVPGTFVVPTVEGVELCVELCEARSVAAHRANFSERDATSAGGRPAAHYLANLPRIEVIASVLRSAWHDWALPPGVERREVATGR